MKPIPPPLRIIREGSVARCHICGSSLKRRWFGLGAAIGCLQPKCWNWHGWSQLPVGSNRPIDLYGAPAKPPPPPAPPPASSFCKCRALCGFNLSGTVVCATGANLRGRSDAIQR